MSKFRGVEIGAKIDTDRKAPSLADLDRDWRIVAQYDGRGPYRVWTWGERWTKATIRALYDGVHAGRLSVVTGRSDDGAFTTYARVSPR